MQKQIRENQISEFYSKGVLENLEIQSLLTFCDLHIYSEIRDQWEKVT